MKKLFCIAILLLVIFAGFEHVFANKYILKDGRVIEGNHALLSRVDEKSGTEDNISTPIVVIDDGLRYVYLSKSQIRHINEEQVPRLETFKTGHIPNYDGDEYVVLGAYSNSTPFDMYGRRLLEIYHTGGIEYAEQVIVELTPYYIRVMGLRADNKPLTWDMRIATNGIPREQITPILMHLIDPKNIEDRKKLVRFYFGGGLYAQADAELESIMQDWKDFPNILQQIRSMSLTIRQQKYQQRIDELEFRWESGQYQFVRKHITTLEQDPHLPERLLEPVRRILQRYDETDQQCQETITALKDLYYQLPELDKNKKILSIISEIEKELNYSTLKRLESFQLYVKDPKLSAAEKLAIGITGWYAGAGANNSRLAVAVTLPETEKLIVDYLCSEHDFLLRQRILTQLKNLETARPDLVAGILATMKPPFSDLPPETSDFPGYYRFTVPNPLIAPGSPKLYGAAEIQYAVQLPPDYNPYQRYPMVVSLNGSLLPEEQLDWWAGSWRNGERIGHATRHGYIVIAPNWNPPEINQSNYDFSIFSHAAVLCAVKDAFRRFSVNTDNVFISGHGIGGTAAWDIALAHPDLWAGAIVFNAVASHYIDAYRSAIRHVPLYLVWGEMEGVGPRRKWNVNATVLNRYLQMQARPGDVTAVRYIGRGMDGFSEEILHILDWMKLRQRNFVPFEFEAETMRPWDSFFWWVEMPNLVADRPENMFDPIDFPAKGATQKTITVQSKLFRVTNNVSVATKPRVTHVQVFLTPDMIDFRAKTSVKVNDKRYEPLNGMVEPDIEVMLEDARTRCDRLHPFWAMLDGK